MHQSAGRHATFLPRSTRTPEPDTRDLFFWVDFALAGIYHPPVLWRMMNLRRWFSNRAVAALGVIGLLPAISWGAGPPAQKLPSALLVYPLIEADGASDTRVEVLNLSADAQLLNCFYVEGDSCVEIGFFVSLTPYQPLAWMVSAGLNDTVSGSAIPPFFGTGEMKCVVVPPNPELRFHNTIQGRATVFAADGRTVSYGAVGFQRLVDGDFTGVVALDGTTYAQCPARLNFDDIILLPCTQDLLTQVPTMIRAQILVTNEFETTFSTAVTFTCFGRFTLGAIADSLTRAIGGTDTAHLNIRGSNGPLLGLVIDSVPFAGKVGTAGNEPSLQGGSSATVTFP
jgi:hypothetical protein